MARRSLILHSVCALAVVVLASSVRADVVSGPPQPGPALDRSQPFHAAIRTAQGEFLTAVNGGGLGGPNDGPGATELHCAARP
jgi:hypothetical protein